MLNNSKLQDFTLELEIMDLITSPVQLDERAAGIAAFLTHRRPGRGVLARLISVITYMRQLHLLSATEFNINHAMESVEEDCSPPGLR